MFALADGDREARSDALTASAARIVALADKAVWIAKGDQLDDLVEAFDAAEPDDPMRERAAALLCEDAIARHRLDIVTERRTDLEALVHRGDNPGWGTDQRCTVRIRMCLAEVTGVWTVLLALTHRTYPSWVTAWVQARYARHLALIDGPGAKQQYLLAIERASAADMLDEAADWLYDLRTVRNWYDDHGRDDQHAIAQVLRPRSRPSQLPGGTHAVQLALRSAQTDEGRDPRSRAERWRWQAFMRGQTKLAYRP